MIFSILSHKKRRRLLRAVCNFPIQHTRGPSINYSKEVLRRDGTEAEKKIMENEWSFMTSESVLGSPNRPFVWFNRKAVNAKDASK